MTEKQRSLSLDVAEPAFGSDEQQRAMEDITDQFWLPVDRLRTFSKDLQSEMEKGLAQDTGAALPMVPSFLSEHPTGQERGEYFALELNGATIRIMKVTFHGRGRTETRQQKFTASENLKHGDARALFDYLAECLDLFLTNIGHQDPEHPLQLGFTFAFPVHQTAVNHGTLIQWTKGFDITGAEGKDVVDLLQQSLKRKHLPVQVMALVNGTVCKRVTVVLFVPGILRAALVGTLLAHNYKSLDTLLGCTFSTGTNCAYYERIDAIPKYQGSSTPSNEMIVNTEWGAFGDDHRAFLPLTRYDNALNRQSSNPGIHLYEKMVSGLYLGEIVRQAMIDLLDRRLLFAGAGGQQELGKYSQELNTPYSFETSYAGQIEQDTTPELDETKHLIESVLGLGDGTTTLTDRRMVKKLCEVVGIRAARLCAAGMASVINKIGAVEGGGVTISVDGTIFQHYPNFTNRVHEALRELYGASVDVINIGTTRDGPGVGAALAAMMTASKSNV
ncbi:hexokinase-domain-containing protein [Endogone sp. FLAS-F59071]|nr:hexokinase-domain-containing protein [Endogone sp. FLAS-F59071]|eukprot:RUS22562.1 hexokinase-domain-containing protein [Endogone sp. FLAS-F59071]